MNLKKQTLTGVFWTFSQQFSVQIINFVVQIILARILMPEAFGLIAMLQIFIAIGNSLMDSGLTSSLIRTKNPDQKDYSTVFLINLLGSVFIYLIIFFCAPLIATFYNQPILESIIKVYTLSFLIRALVGVQTTKLTKEMNFKLQMVMQIPSVILGGVVGILLAENGYGVWSLVWLNLIQSFLFMIQHWFWTPWRPDFKIDKRRLKYHFNFGYKITLGGLLNSVYQNLYNIIIGKYFSVSQVGFFTQAETMGMFPVRQINTALVKVTFPAFASIQNDNNKLKNAYKVLMQQVVFMVAPLMIFLIVFAEPIFLLLLTEKWLPSVPYFQILCLSAIVYPIQTYNLNILMVKGRSDLNLKLEAIKKPLLIIGMLSVIPLGIYGLLWFHAISSYLLFYVNSFYSGKMINYSFMAQLRDIFPILLISILCGVISYIFKLFVLSPFVTNLILTIIIGLFFYFIIYLSISYISRLYAFRYTISLVKKI